MSLRKDPLILDKKLTLPTLMRGSASSVLAHQVLVTWTQKIRKDQRNEEEQRGQEMAANWQEVVARAKIREPMPK
jgi:hypothetical protein